MISPINEAQDRLQRFTFASKRYGLEATRRWLEKAAKRRGLPEADREALRMCASIMAQPGFDNYPAAVMRCRRILARVKTRNSSGR